MLQQNRWVACKRFLLCWMKLVSGQVSSHRKKRSASKRLPVKKIYFSYSLVLELETKIYTNNKRSWKRKAAIITCFGEGTASTKVCIGSFRVETSEVFVMSEEVFQCEV